MTTDDVKDDDQNIQPEKTFDEHVASVIHRFKDQLGDDLEIIVIVKSDHREEPYVFTKGHPYEVTKLGVDFVRHMKESLAIQLEC